MLATRLATSIGRQEGTGRHAARTRIEQQTDASTNYTGRGLDTFDHNSASQQKMNACMPCYIETNDDRCLMRQSSKGPTPVSRAAYRRSLDAIDNALGRSGTLLLFGPLDTVSRRLEHL